MNEISPAAASQYARTTRETESRAQAIPPIIQVRNLEKTYTTARGALTLFRGLDLEVQAGEMVAIVGQSGAGKSTLLHILGALDAPTAGTVHCASVNVVGLSERQAAEFRNREIGYVWQFHYLLPEFTARENVALARALVNNPRLLLADEPTGDLDAATAGLVFDLIERLHATHGLTSILVTHNLDLAARCTRTLRLEAGRLETKGLESGKQEARGPEAGRRDGGRLTTEEASVPQADQAAADS